MRYAVINPDKVVINVIIWDAISEWKQPEDCILIKSDVANIGDVYDMDKHIFIKPKSKGE